MRSAADAGWVQAWVGHRSETVAATLVIAVAVVILFDTASAIVGTWYISTTYSHGFLIIPICVYLVWRERAELMAAEARPTLSGVVVVAFSAVCWLVGEATDTPLVKELSLVALIQGIILVMYGWSICRKLAFPLLYLYFAVPFGQAMVPPLQSVTAALAVAMLRGVGVPVFEDGNVISVPTGDFYVAEACSGIRFLIASMALGALFAGIMYRSWWRRGAFLGLSFLIPILANGLRAFGIILIANFTSNEFAMGVDHVIYGWMFFTVVMVLTLAIGVSFRDLADSRGVTRGGTVHSAVGSTSAGGILIAGFVALTPVVLVKLYSVSIERPPMLESLRLQLPRIEPPWHGVDGSQDPAAPKFAAPDAELHADFVDGERRAYLHIGYYLRNRRGSQAVTSTHEVDGGKLWIGAATGATTVMIDGEPVAAQFARMVRGRQGHVVWYWYWIDGRFTGNPYFAKLLEAKAKLVGGEQRAAIIVVGADYSDSPADADNVLSRFIAGTPDLLKYLSGSGRP